MAQILDLEDSLTGPVMLIRIGSLAWRLEAMRRGRMETAGIMLLTVVLLETTILLQTKSGTLLRQILVVLRSGTLAPALQVIILAMIGINLARDYRNQLNICRAVMVLTVVETVFGRLRVTTAPPLQ